MVGEGRDVLGKVFWGGGGDGEREIFEQAHLSNILIILRSKALLA